MNELTLEKSLKNLIVLIEMHCFLTYRMLPKCVMKR
jgi:hypothetical protein